MEVEEDKAEKGKKDEKEKETTNKTKEDDEKAEDTSPLKSEERPTSSPKLERQVKEYLLAQL